MSCSNLCKTSPTESIHKNIDNSTCSLKHSKQAVNLMEGDAISCVFNSDPSAGKTILITNGPHNNDDLKGVGTHSSPFNFSTNNNIKNKSSITIYTHSSDSEIPNKLQAALPTPAINILISNHFEHPTSRNHENNATTAATTTTATATTTKSTIKEQKLELDDFENKTKSIETTQIKKELPNSPERNLDNEETNEINTPADTAQSNVQTDITADQVSQTNSMPCSTKGDYRNISAGDDVLIQEQNAKIYLGTMVACENDKYQIKYYDESVKWSPADKIEKLLLSKEANIIFCIICKLDEPDNRVEVCEKCGRGYHRKCFPSKYVDSDNFKCLRCDRRKQIINYGDEQLSMVPNYTGDSSTNYDLPYDINSLTWDSLHRQNAENIYCYCGKKGKWYMQMIQCARCLQWFHANCLRCLSFPLYFGDRFYLFSCSVCNHGREFIRRLHMNIENVVHLLLFNLTLHHSKRYFNFSNVIVPYARDNWAYLQLPVKIQNMMHNDIKDEISKALRTNAEIFQSSSDNVTKTKEWALKSRSTPSAPNINLPPGPVLTEKYINDLFSDRAKIYFLPHNPTHSLSESISNDSKVFSLIYGKNYLSTIDNGNITIASISDTDSRELAISPTDDDFKMDDDDLDFCDYLTIKRKITSDTGNTEQEFDKSAKISNNNHKKRRFSNLTKNLNEARKFKSKDAPHDSYDSSDEKSNRGTLDSIIPPPRDFFGSNNPFLNDKSTSLNIIRNLPSSSDKNSSMINHTNSIGNCHSSANDIAALTTQNKKLLSKFDKSKVRIVRTIKRRLCANDLGPNMKIKRRKMKNRTGNIEVIRTSTIYEMSKSAAYIPIHNDFKDKPEADVKMENNDSIKCFQLSDIRQFKDGDLANIYDSNTNSNYKEKLISSTSSTSDLTALTSSTPNNYSFNANPLNGSPSSIKVSDKKPMDDLQSSFNIYFGIANRIANGENFTIKGKRISLDGRLQYLIEWDGV